ncbi:MAG: hypothetical protein SGBAC_006306 [Bacillariaceae sp.]
MEGEDSNDDVRKGIIDSSSCDHQPIDDDGSATVVTSTSISTARSGKRRKRKKKASIDDLKRNVSELMQMFDEHGIFVPLPDSTNGQQKNWSNRNYGADKKRQRKNAERELLEARIIQLEQCLESEKEMGNLSQTGGWENE